MELHLNLPIGLEHELSLLVCNLHISHDVYQRHEDNDPRDGYYDQFIYGVNSSLHDRRFSSILASQFLP